jgi:hypothetical protein
MNNCVRLMPLEDKKKYACMEGLPHLLKKKTKIK